MKDIIKRISELQPHYSSSNTPEMKERGELIRGALVNEVRNLLPRLQLAFDQVIDDLGVEGSDGIGRKTEAPWVRLFSRAMSPNPRDGFYLVLHFAADGSAVFVTVGCGSTVWRDGDLIPVSDEELASRTTWAKEVVLEKWETLAPFADEIHLGATAPLPRTFEKATALACRIDILDLDSTDLEALVFSASERLNQIYLAQLNGRDVTPADQDANEVSQISRPLRRRAGRQGFGLTAPERRAVELRAMALALEFLRAEGYICQDTSASESFDIIATRGDVSLKVEVKGTTSDFCDSILMTRNEVELHRREKGKTGLIIVSKVRLKREEQTSQAFGGLVEALLSWDIDQWAADPIAFQLRRSI
jgi:hypothetical protein